MAAPRDDWSPAVSAWAVEHAHDLTLFGPAAPGDRPEVVLVTDPWSVWCWGFEPVRRALQHRYPTIAFRNVVGGMFPVMPDPEAMSFNVERFFTVVQRTTGMPLRLDATREDRPRSTYPACIHVAAARLLRPDLKAAYLRHLQKTIYLNARNISRANITKNVAATMGIPVKKFHKTIASKEPKHKFRENLSRLQTHNIHSYPTYLVRSGTQLVRIEGFQSLPSLLSIVESVTGRLHPAAPPPPLLDLFPAGERLATREVAEVLDESLEVTVERHADLEAQGALARERHAGGDVWLRAL